MTATSPSSGPKNVRQGLSQWEPGAHLWAPFGTHWKAGGISLIPFGIIFFTTQPIDQALSMLTLGGFTVFPALAGSWAAAFALVSMAILHRLRFRDDLRFHLAVYAAVGAVGLMLVSMAVLTLVEGAQTGIYDPSSSPVFLRTLLLAPLVGGLGAAFGRWAVDKGIYWHRWIVRNPLPDVFTFVEGKHDKDDFKKL